ncbi:MAG: hypothetical protein A2404_17570 [Bdellovibrionales bacterium RIFOXYC1_FULL_39_130]|nr:MAG: hypothetical protein A2404_17570 [Bdellovibrionales bacterium RIFOXYC1_FULL_39_130]HLE12165.1 ATP-binding protein [Bacteriovoracaceae bacterium]
MQGIQLQKKYATIEDIFNVGHKIEKTVHRISKIIKGLKSFSRDSENDPYEDFDLNEIINESLDILTDKIKQNNVKITFTPVESKTIIQCRESDLSQVFVNLISNGIDAIKDLKDKWINISGKVKQDRLVITVVDAGAGIPLNIQVKMFQPFFNKMGKLDLVKFSPKKRTPNSIVRYCFYTS